MYEVFECEKPASSEGYPDLTKECWATNKFETLEEANEYVRAWLGQYEKALDHDLEINEPYYYGGEDYVVIHYVEDYPKLISKMLKELEERKVKLLRAVRIVRILESITVPEELSAYPEIYDSWQGYRGRLQINGFTNLKTQIPPIAAQLAKAGYKVKKFEDSAQQSTRTYYMCLREDENVEDIYVLASLANQKTRCHYVQVGTRHKEEPIYELRCDDDVVESKPDAFTGETVESDNESGEQREPESIPQDGEVSGDSTNSANLSEGLQQDSEVEGPESEVDA